MAVPAAGALPGRCRSCRLGRWQNGCGCVRSMMTRAGGWYGSCAGAAGQWWP